MVNEKFRKALNVYAEEGGEEIKILDDHAYDASILGVTNSGQLVYDFEKMIAEFAEDEDCSLDEAQEWIEYNTLRAIPYFGEGAPIIMGITKEILMDIYGDDNEDE